ncbi:MAG: PQQ-like beta-propeller repeat protein [Spirochaetes bacterium]|nr:PQQ-like beta-propeller repeat protein [Spirochaetota bacterium]
MKKRSRKILIACFVLAVLSVPIGLFVKNYFTSGWADRGAATKPIPKPSALAVPVAVGPDDWPSYRGGHQDNSSRTTGIRTDWRGGLRRAWDVSYLCQGNASTAWSCPAVQGRHLVVMGREQDRDLVFCLESRTGALLWVSGYAATNQDNYGTGPRATPTIDGDLVYTVGRGGDLVAWRLADGAPVWKRSLVADGGAEPEWGFSASALVSGDRLFLQGGKEIQAVAYHKKTGEVLWKTAGGIGSYSSPVLAGFGGEASLLVLHGEGLAAFAPETGAKRWELPFKTANGNNITTPVVDGPWIFVSAAYSMGGLGIVATNGSARIAWRTKDLQAHHTDPQLIDGHVYGYSGFSKQNRGDFKCLDLATGRTLWKSDAIGCGTAIRVEDKLLCLDHKGNLFLVKPDPKGLVVLTAFPKAIPGVQELSWTKPVLADGLLYLRYRQRLICYRLKG